MTLNPFRTVAALLALIFWTLIAVNLPVNLFLAIPAILQHLF